MILQALYQLAEREDLIGAYQKGQIHYQLHIDRDGHMLGLVPTQDERGRGLIGQLPRLIGTRTVNTLARPFVDKADYSLGLGAGGVTDKRTAARAADFRRHVEACVAATNDSGARAVLAFLDRTPSWRDSLFAQRPAAEWTGDEVVAFVLDEDGSLPVHLRPAVRAWWTAQRSESSAAGRPLRCLVTGAVAVPERTHPQIKLRLPGAQGGGASLVTFNASAFEAHDLKQGDNAPVSPAAATGYTAALDSLIERTDKRAFRCGVRVGDNVIVFWTRDAHDGVEHLLDLFDPSTDDAIRAAESPWRGTAPSPLDATPFYAVTLGVNVSRVVVRDWFTSTMADVNAAVARYFDDLALAGQDAPLPIAALVRALRARDDSDLVPDLGVRLFRAALRGTALPREILATALRRLRVPPEKKNIQARQLLAARVALIKATLRRLPRGSLPPLEVTVSLDEENCQPPYLLGRLFAVLERLQGAALGDINATIRDRYFGAASATPALVFPRLIRLSMHHAAKADSGPWFERLIGSIVAGLPAARFSRQLNLEEQGLFAVGYYHQRQSFKSFFERRGDAPTLTPSESPTNPAE